MSRLARSLRVYGVSSRAQEDSVDIGFVVFVGTLLFFAALHQWPPDGRRWQRQELDQPTPLDVNKNATTEPSRSSR
jgi:hypothetical protein